MHSIIINWFSDLPKEIATFLIALIPVTELRAALPLAYNVYGLSAFSAWFWSVSGTFFAMLLIVVALDPVAKFLSSHVGVFDKLFQWIFEHTRKKADKKMEKYGQWAIFILAATPIPFIGGMTGALAAFAFGVPLKISAPLLLLGTMASGGIVLGVIMLF